MSLLKASAPTALPTAQSASTASNVPSARNHSKSTPPETVSRVVLAPSTTNWRNLARGALSTAAAATTIISAPLAGLATARTLTQASLRSVELASRTLDTSMDNNARSALRTAISATTPSHAEVATLHS